MPTHLEIAERRQRIVNDLENLLRSKPFQIDRKCREIAEKEGVTAGYVRRLLSTRVGPVKRERSAATALEVAVRALFGHESYGAIARRLDLSREYVRLLSLKIREIMDCIRVERMIARKRGHHVHVPRRRNLEDRADRSDTPDPQAVD